MKHHLLLGYIKLKNFLDREDGASAIEYAIIAGLIAVGIIAAATTLGGDITTVFENISKAFQPIATGA